MSRFVRSLAMTGLLLVGLQTARAAEVVQDVETTASPTKVWSVIKSFDGIATWWPPAKSSPADKGDKIGSVRTITLKAPGDPTIIEKLTAHNNSKRSYSYIIVKVDPKVIPVTGYSSTISVTKTKDGSKVTWKGDFTPAGADEPTAVKAVTGAYRAGLDNIKTLAEQ